MRDTDLKHILADIEQVAAATEELLRASRSSGRSNDTAKPSQHGTANGAGRAAIATTTREYLHRNPWRTLGIATGIGFLVGCMLTGRPRHRSPRK